MLSLRSGSSSRPNTTTTTISTTTNNNNNSRPNTIPPDREMKTMKTERTRDDHQRGSNLLPQVVQIQTLFIKTNKKNRKSVKYIN